MKKKIIILSLLALCLLSFPVSAWEESFENHPFDTGFSDTTGGFFEINNDHGYAMKTYINATRTFNISRDFDGYLAFTSDTTFYTATAASNVGLRLYDSEGQIVFEDLTMCTMPSISGDTYDPRRIEFIETTSGAGIECYRDGELKESTAYIIDDFDEIETISVVFTPQGMNLGLIIDDLTNEFSMIGCDDEITYQETDQYFTIGCPYSKPGYNWFYRVYNMDMDILVSDTIITNLSEKSLPVGLFTESGLYSIKLYYIYDGSTHFSNTRYFEYVGPAGYSISVENPEVEPGENLNVYCYNASGFSLVADGPGSDDSETYSITTDEQMVNYPIPSDSVSGTGVVILRNPSGGKVAYEYFEVVGGVGGDSEISFDKSAYTNTDKVAITYSDLPAGCQVQLTGTKAGSSTKVISEIYTKTGSGVFYYQLSGEDISSLYVVAAYDGELLDSDSATIASGDDYVIYGTVYDANTLTAIEGASVAVGGTVQYTNDAGRYDMSVSAGTKNLVVGADGYNILSTTIDIVSVSTLKNIYLVPITASEGETGIIYGACADYDTGQAVETAYIQISNGSITYSTLGRSSTGAYIFEGLQNGSVWTLSASKTGYDNYQKEITVNGSTFQLIKLVSQDSSSTSGDDDDSSTSSTDSTDRPSREAAKESLTWLEETMPGLIKLVVVIFICALVGVKF
ncbi:hypothetical protein ACSAZL_06485 [Methanosarcina sp. T3]|uniref:hypothetical protein n=1 Tax=Methanosarcina sp. T3 TaxID=3439062 RepID=UPI003F85AC6E